MEICLVFVYFNIWLYYTFFLFSWLQYYYIILSIIFLLMYDISNVSIKVKFYRKKNDEIVLNNI